MDHGIPLTPHFLFWAAAIPAGNAILVSAFRAANWWPESTRRGSRSSDIMAYELVAILSVLYMTAAGFICYFKLFDVTDRDVIEGHFYARSEFVENHLVYPMIVYQVWNLVLSLILVELRDIALIGHHAVTAAVGYFGLHPFAHFNAVIFFGIAEVTNIPLIVVEVFKLIPKLREQYPAINQFARYSFALAFTLVRLIFWPIYSYRLWNGCMDLLTTGKAHSTAVVSIFVFANIFLTGLQFFWGSKIYSFLLSKKKDKKEE